MLRSISFICCYLHKRYLLILFAFLLVAIISLVLEILVYTKYLSYPIFHVFSHNPCNSILIYLDILEKQFYLNQFRCPVFIYNCSVSSSEKILNEILQKCSSNSIDSNDVYRLIQQYPILKYLQSGQMLSCLVLSKKKIKCLMWLVSSQEIHLYNDINSIYTKGVIKILKKSSNEPLYTILFLGELNGTFIDSARHLGLEENCIVDVVNALQYQLDFRKLKQGDRFSILVSTYRVDGENKLKNKLIGARLNSSGKDYYVFRANNGKLYNQEAVRLGGNFIRFPLLHPYRISSNFNLNRLNPVTGLISPHAGVDFAVPIGTPVLSIGDGEVIISKYSKIAGNYIGIKHDYQCMTRYMHLKKILVKPGQKVKQGQQIALSGNTGRSTGPHLHFEVWLGRHPVNPLTANILNTERLLGNERIKYLHQINEIVPKLRFD